MSQRNKELDPLLNHEYDGIREYDNPTPGWWHMIFFGTILFAIFYVVFWHFSPMGWNVYDKLAADQSRALEATFGDMGELTGDEQTIMRYATDEKWLTAAAAWFAGKCISCHGANGEGVVGPNLTDDYFINIKTPEDIYKMISEGAVAKGMPAWGKQMHPNKVVLLASYVASLRGKNLPGKGQQGEMIDPWPVLQAPEDSVNDNGAG